MTYEPRIGEDTATIKSEGYSVRVAMENNKALFACKDILSMCGYKCPSDVAKKMSAKIGSAGVIKMIGYPVIGARGMRRIQMYFADDYATREMIARSNIGSDARKWLEESVLTFRKQTPAAECTEPVVPVVQCDEQELPDTIDYKRLNRSVDLILVELMEIKKNLMDR